MSKSILQQIFSFLVQFLWPKNKKYMKIKVFMAVFCLFLAKAANVGTPPILGYAFDSLIELSQGINVYMLIPLALIASYGIAQVAALFIKGKNIEMRDKQKTSIDSIHV